MDNDKHENNLASRRQKDKKAKQERPSVSILIPGIRFPLRILLPPNNSYLSETTIDGGVDEEETNESPPKTPLAKFNSLNEERSPLSVSPSGSVDISKLLIESSPQCLGVASGQVNKRRKNKGKNRKKARALVEQSIDENLDDTPGDISNLESSSMTKIHITSTGAPNELIYQDVSSGHGEVSFTTNPSNSVQPNDSKILTPFLSTENFIKAIISSVVKVESPTGMSNTPEIRDESIITENIFGLPIPLLGMTGLKESADQTESTKLGSSQGAPSNRNLVDASVLTIGNATQIDQSDTCCQTDKSIDINSTSVQTGESNDLTHNHTAQDSPNKNNAQRSSNQERMSSRNSCDDKKVTKTRRPNASGGKSNDKRRTSANVRAENPTDKSNKTQEGNNTKKPDEEKEHPPKKRENINKGYVVKNRQIRNDLKHKKNSHPARASSEEKIGTKAGNTERSGRTGKQADNSSAKLVLPSKRKSNESISIRIIHVNKNYEESPYIDDSETMRAVSLHDVGRTSEEKLHVKDLFTETIQQGATGIVIQHAAPQNTANSQPEPIQRKPPRVKIQEAECSTKEEHGEKPKSPENQLPRTTNMKKSNRRTTNKPETPRQEFNLIEEMKRILSAMWTMLYYFWSTYI